MPGPSELPDFPPPRQTLDTPASLRSRGVCLRRAAHADLPWLCRLYASTRAEELAAVPWPENMRQAFLQDQFALQHRHYLAHHACSDFLVIEGKHGPVGRFYLQRTAPDHLLVDITLLPEHRGCGIGRALIAAAQDDARQHGRGMQLHVLRHNAAARRLYERLGFTVTGGEDEGLHHHMRWSVATP